MIVVFEENVILQSNLKEPFVRCWLSFSGRQSRRFGFPESNTLVLHQCLTTWTEQSTISHAAPLNMCPRCLETPVATWESRGHRPLATWNDKQQAGGCMLCLLSTALHVQIVLTGKTQSLCYSLPSTREWDVEGETPPARRHKHACIEWSRVSSAAIVEESHDCRFGSKKINNFNHLEKPPFIYKCFLPDNSNILKA